MYGYNYYGINTEPTFNFLIAAIYLIFWIQTLMAYGTAYRKTRSGGDNGATLFGWMIVYTFAAIIPGLGFYLWRKSRRH